MYGFDPKITLVKPYCRAVLESRFSNHRRRNASLSFGLNLVWRKAFLMSPVIHRKYIDGFAEGCRRSLVDEGVQVRDKHSVMLLENLTLLSNYALSSSW